MVARQSIFLGNQHEKINFLSHQWSRFLVIVGMKLRIIVYNDLLDFSKGRAPEYSIAYQWLLGKAFSIATSMKNTVTWFINGKYLFEFWDKFFILWMNISAVFWYLVINAPKDIVINWKRTFWSSCICDLKVWQVVQFITK